MAVLKGTLTDNLGAPISGASVYVYLQNTTTPATLYSDFEMTAGTTNPLTTEADGAYLCYLADGYYDLHAVKTDVTFDDSDAVDEQAFDGPAFKAQKAAASGLASLNSSSKVVEEPASKGQASGIASLDASSKVVQDPASAVWVDYSATSSIVGWSSFTTKIIKYLQIGKLCIVRYQIDGTSNSTSTSFTLPSAGQNTESLSTVVVNSGNVQADPGRAVFSSYSIIFYKDGTGASWTASGQKAITGVFIYELS